MAQADLRLYPTFAVENNKKPNRLLNFPIFGIFIKIILLIPVFIVSFFLGLAAIVLLFLNWFVVLFTGKYWQTAYTYFVGLTRFSTKINLYMFGITDKYPGFSLSTSGLFTMDIAKPEKPNRWLAIPFVGILIRLILLIPYLIFVDVMQRGAGVAMFLSWFVILFKGRLPESLYEFESDSIRVNMASGFYLLGISDKYPSFHISMNHQTAKILLIIAGALLMVSSMGNSSPHDYDYDKSYEYTRPVSNTNMDNSYNTY